MNKHVATIEVRIGSDPRRTKSFHIAWDEESTSETGRIAAIAYAVEQARNYLEFNLPMGPGCEARNA